MSSDGGLTGVGPPEHQPSPRPGTAGGENVSDLPPLSGSRVKVIIRVPEMDIDGSGNIAPSRVIPLDVSPTDTVESVKTQVQDELRIPTMQRSKQRLLLRGKHLREGLTIDSYNIANEATIDVETDFPLTISLPPDRSLVLDVFSSDLVSAVKVIVQDKELIPPALRSKQSLLLNGKRLKDNQTLAESKVERTSIVEFDDNEKAPQSPTLFLGLGVFFLFLGLIVFLIALILCCT